MYIMQSGAFLPTLLRLLCKASFLKSEKLFVYFKVLKIYTCKVGDFIHCKTFKSSLSLTGTFLWGCKPSHKGYPYKGDFLYTLKIFKSICL